MLENLTTETRNNSSMNLDTMSSESILTLMNDEDAKIIHAVRKVIPAIKAAVDIIAISLANKGRLIYIGAGTSGRIGLLDAVECPPTFGTNPNTVVGLIAGGDQAFIKAVEGAEDDTILGVNDLKNIHLSKDDALVGIAASGRTPYVLEGLKYANSIGASTIAISNNHQSLIGKEANIAIEIITGPEVLTGSTRLKAGTAQKIVCNMLSTTAMIRNGKVFGNLMVDVQTTNQKLEERAKHIVIQATSCDYETAEQFLQKSNNNPKLAIIMILTGLTYGEAFDRLNSAKGFIRNTLFKSTQDGQIQHYY